MEKNKKNTRETIIDILQTADGYVSGESIAERAKVSRSAVWKHVEKLKKDGYRFESVKNKGYRLIADGSVINQTYLSKTLKNVLSGGVEVKKQVTSTNKLLKQMAEQGCAQDFLLIANSQTDGIGRYGRKFFSPTDSGLYFSLLIKPQIDISLTTNVTVAMAVAVATAIEETTHQPTQIKWVNDILVDGKKTCGILTEGSIDLETMSMKFIIVGVGINLYEPADGFDSSIKNIAGSITKNSSLKIDKNLLVTKIITNFYMALQDLTSPNLLRQYRDRLAFVGSMVDVLKNGEKIDEGQLLGVDENYKLQIKTSQGNLLLDSGEISTRLSQ